MSTILVTGGTGSVGSSTVKYLLEKQHHVRIYTHQAQPSSLPPGVDVYSGDIQTGSGLAEATRGIDAIVHCASNYQKADQATDLKGSRNLLQAAQANGSPHIVYISIVGIDRSDYKYYQSKLAIEQLIEQSNLPWTILRATQFHTLVLGIIQAAEQKGSSPLIIPAGLHFQSIEHDEVGQHLAELAELPAVGHATDMGGPEIFTLEEMTEIYLRIYNKPGPIQPEPLPEDLFDAFRSGVNIVPEHKVGHITWEQFLHQNK